jgi:hypothetical protein
MTLTIGSATFSSLTAQPFGYEETDTKRGFTARRWLITGLLTPTEWLALIEEYNSWRDLRILDEDSLKSGTVGTTVSFSGTGAGSEDWSEIECWFSRAPAGDQAGGYRLANMSLVDAAEELEVLLREQETSEEEEEIDLGTLTIGDAELKLLSPPDSYGAPPALQLTAGGVHFITGPLVAEKIQNVEGVTDSSGWEDIKTWYEEQVISIPSTGDWFPISPPSATVRSKVVSGVKTVEYVVTLSIGQVI